jgi:hypothetical protein
MYQLHAIRSELQGGINIFSPGWVGGRLGVLAFVLFLV